MGRKRLLQKNKRVAFNISIKKEILDEFKKKVREENETASRVIEKHMIQYLKEKNK